MSYTKSTIFMMVRDGATLNELTNATGRDGAFIRFVISEIRSRGFEITFSNNTYKIGA